MFWRMKIVLYYYYDFFFVLYYILRGCAHDVASMTRATVFIFFSSIISTHTTRTTLWEEDHLNDINNINGKFITTRANLILCSRSVICTVQEWMNNKVVPCISVCCFSDILPYGVWVISSMNELDVFVCVCVYKCISYSNKGDVIINVWALENHEWAIPIYVPRFRKIWRRLVFC